MSAGVAGTGKTTLAHVVAAHCGFRVVEVNASDERTAASLTRRITDVAQMQSVLDGEGRQCAARQTMSPCAHACSSKLQTVAILCKMLSMPLCMQLRSPWSVVLVVRH
jgi:DNA polymerase III delta prime subunit